MLADALCNKSSAPFGISAKVFQSKYESSLLKCMVSHICWWYITFSTVHDHALWLLPIWSENVLGLWLIGKRTFLQDMWFVDDHSVSKSIYLWSYTFNHTTYSYICDALCIHRESSKSPHNEKNPYRSRSSYIFLWCNIRLKKNI